MHIETHFGSIARRPLVRVSRVGMIGGVLAIAFLAGGVGGAAFGNSGTGAVLYVDDSAPAGGDGASWNSAFRHVQDALLAAGEQPEVTEIRIAQGLYKPDEDASNPNGTGDRNASFELLEGVAMMGGYAGFGAPDPDARDPEIYETILSGDLLGNDGPDFQNYGENALTVVDFNYCPVLDGFIVERGASDGDTGAGVNIEGVGAALIRNCILRQNLSETDEFLAGGAGIRVALRHLTIESVAVHDNSSGGHGGGIYVYDGGGLTATGCSFTGNVASVTGGAVAAVDFPHAEGGDVALSGCQFLGNFALTGAGLFCSGIPNPAISRTTFIANQMPATGGGGAVAIGGAESAAVDSCAFFDNGGGWLGGGLAMGDGDLSVVNCSFSRNSASERGGAIHFGDSLTIINSTFSGNSSHAIDGSSNVTLEVTNSIFWNNVPAPFSDDDDVIAIHNSCIQGGWSGSGSNNIDEDPLFVQPGADNLRLSYGSPCVNAGANSFLPPGIEFDLAGEPRIQDGTVDMGAYEGEFEQLPASAVAYDLDQSDYAILLPESAAYDPINSTAAVMINLTGGNNHTASITHVENPFGLIEPRGYSRLRFAIDSQTTLANGSYINTIQIPFNINDLDGADPLLVNLTIYDESTGNWALAVSANAQNSPGHSRPIGDRITVVGGQYFGLTGERGDYGVYWDPSTQKGFAWAVVDRAGLFAHGIALCPADALQPPNGDVNFDDLTFVLEAWGDDAGPWDVNNDGVVDFHDMVDLLAHWGPCDP